MAERSQFWTTNNTGDGPSSGFTRQNWEDMLRHLFNSNAAATNCVLRGVDNELVVSGSSSPVSVAPGAALVYGYYYRNDAALNLAVATPSIGTTGFHVVLRVSWAAQTVRAVAVRSSDGVSTPPAVTQSPGTTYEVRLATGQITTGGVITLTDVRGYADYSAKEQVLPTIPSVSSFQVLPLAAGNLLRQVTFSAGVYGEVQEASGSWGITPRLLINKSKFPATARFRLYGRGTPSGGGGGSTWGIRLYNETTGAALAASTVETTTPASGAESAVISGDFYAQLAAGENMYRLQVRMDDTSNNMYLGNVQIYVDW